MRTWILGSTLALLTAGTVYMVLSGSLHTVECRPCVASVGTPDPVPNTVEVAPTVDVVQVVDVAALLAPPADPQPTRFVSFEEPPLAQPTAARAPDLIPVAFSEPRDPGLELAPAPRRVRQPGPLPLATSDDEF